MNRNEAIAWIDEECTNIDPRDKDYVDAMKAIRDLLAAPTEVDKAAEDMLTYGQSFMKGGKRIDPKDVVLPPTEVDDEEVEAITGELESAALALPARSHIEINGEYYPLNVCTDAAEFIRRLHTQLREQAKVIKTGKQMYAERGKWCEKYLDDIKLAERQRDEALAILESATHHWGYAKRQAARIRAMSITTGEEL